MIKLQDLKFNQEGKCPLCGCEMISYDSIEADGEAVWYPCECEKCGATWQEVYNISFAQVDNVKDNNGEEIYNSWDNEEQACTD